AEAAGGDGAAEVETQRVARHHQVLGRFLDGEEDRLHALAHEGGRGLQAEDRLARARLAHHEHRAALGEASVRDAIEAGDAAGDLGDAGGVRAHSDGSTPPRRSRLTTMSGSARSPTTHAVASAGPRTSSVGVKTTRSASARRASWVTSRRSSRTTSGS